MPHAKNHAGKPLQILVTGGTGFIGTHLVNELVRRYRNSTIDVVDDCSNSLVEGPRREAWSRDPLLRSKPQEHIRLPRDPLWLAVVTPIWRGIVCHQEFGQHSA